MENNLLAPSRSFASALSAISLTRSKNSSQYKTFLDANGIFAECLHKISLAPLDYAISSFSSLDSQDSASRKDFAKALLARFLVTYQYEDLRKALSLVLDMQKNEKSEKPTSRESPTAKRVFMNFRLSFDLELIQNCLNLFREIPKHPYDAISSQCLASCLLIRYHCAPQMADVDEAIDILRQLLKTCPSSQRLFPFYTLAAALLLRVIGTSNTEDIDQVNSVLSSLAEAQKDRNALLHRVRACLFNEEDQEDQLPRDTAISLFEETIAFLPLRHPDRPILLNDLARALPNSTISDTEFAIALLNDALRFYPTDNPSHGEIAWKIAKRFLELYSSTHEAEHIDSGMDAFRVAASCERSKVSVRCTTAREWAKTAHRHRHPSALEAYDRVMGLLPRVSLLESKDRVAMIPSGLACSAAGCAIAAGQLEKAIEFLESRGTFWSQALQLRTPLDELSVLSPSLAQKFRRILEELEGTFSFDDLPDPEKKPLPSDADLQNLYLEYHEVLGEIRKLDGFQDFLLPKSMAKIYSAASNGPIVVFTASPESGCDALIVRSNRVLHVPLRGISFVEVKALRTLMQIILYPNGSRSAFTGSVDAALSDLVQLKIDQVTTESRLRTLLSILWTQVAQPVINALELEKSDTPPRIWFCPTGPFASLPIHAAGIYEGSSKDCVSDYVLCSYTITLGALMLRPPSSTDRFKMFLVEKPRDDSDEKLSEIKPYIPAKNLVVCRKPSIQNVLDNLADASIVHLACQAMQFPSDPARSLFAASDGNLEIARIAKHASLPKARLAILSSCEAVLGDDELPNEVLDVGGAMQLAGFRSVVTTIWKGYEHDIPRIVEDFYFHLFSSVDQNSDKKQRACFSALRRVFKSRTSSAYNGPDTRQSAQALHQAVAGLRSRENCPLERWVPFIHYGM